MWPMSTAVISKLGIRWHQGDQHCEEIFTNCAAEKLPATLRLAGRLVVLCSGHKHLTLRGTHCIIDELYRALARQ